MSLADILETGPWTDGSWQDLGACRGADVELFFAVEEDEQQRALEYCASCEVREECLRTAVLSQEMYGIWGGTLENDRRRLIRDVRRKQRENRRTSDTDAA